MNALTKTKKLLRKTKTLTKHLPKRIIIVEVPISNNADSVKAIAKAFNDLKLKSNFIIIENQRIEKVRIKTTWQW